MQMTENVAEDFFEVFVFAKSTNKPLRKISRRDSFVRKIGIQAKPLFSKTKVA